MAQVIECDRCGYQKKMHEKGGNYNPRDKFGSVSLHKPSSGGSTEYEPFTKDLCGVCINDSLKFLRNEDTFAMSDDGKSKTPTYG